MASVNQVTLIGYLADEPKQIPTKNSQFMCSFSMGTTEKGYTTQQGVQYPDRTEWHNITLFGKLAEVSLKFLHKGSQVYIQGKIRTRKYTDKQTNADRYITEIEAENMQMLDKAPANNQQQTQQAAAPYQQQQGYAPAPAYGQAPAYPQQAPQMQAGGYYQQQGQTPMYPQQGQGKDDVPF